MLNKTLVFRCAERSDTFTTYSTTAQQCQNSTGSLSPVGTADYNASGDAITGVGKIPEKMPTIAKVVVAAIIIGILVRYLMVRYT